MTVSNGAGPMRIKWLLVSRETNKYTYQILMDGLSSTGNSSCVLVFQSTW